MNELTRYSGQKLGPFLSAQGRMQKWVATQAGVHESLISHLIAGRRTVDHDVATRISSVLGVPLFFIFESHERDSLDSSKDDEEQAA